MANITGTQQSTFATPEEKVRGVFERAADRDFGKVLIGVSGGTDSVLAAWLTAKYGPEYGITPDAVVHCNTGLGVPQTQLTAQIVAALLDCAFIEANNGTLADRVLKHGWPMVGKKGHFFERIERKEDVFDAVHAAFQDEQLWISGARSNESDERRMNVPDSGVADDGRRTRQTWASPCVGLTSEEKWDWIERVGLPVPETYRWLGFSGECVACSYDDGNILTELGILAPNLAWAVRSLTQWLYMRGRRGDIELSPKQLCWGWSPDVDDTREQWDLDGEYADFSETWLGCSTKSCKDRDVPDQVFDLPDGQIVDKADVRAYWAGGFNEIVDRFRGGLSLSTHPPKPRLMAHTDYTVGPMPGDSSRWRVLANGRRVSQHNKKRTAVERARQLASGSDTITVQRANGQFQKRIQPR